jgi:glycosyltransferase A (GT-A) superfamily protein (DUF2064 family)
MIKDSIILLNEVLKRTPFKPIISYSPRNDSAENLIHNLITRDMREECQKFIDMAIFVPQTGKTIGDRFSNALNHVFEDLKLFSIIIIGSDTPHLSPSYLIQGLEFLASNPKGVTIGPSQKGGFYLFGLNPPFPDQIGQVFQKQSIHNELGNILELFSNHKVHVLPTVIDIDTFSDLRTVFSEVYARYFTNFQASNKRIAMHTWSLLNTLDSSIWGSPQESQIRG